ncbi:MAG: hypothetical protein HY902_06250 [Deltaproteobacteria bacterium]|nr:hypothetical protein [Deltaproteobacteria bacterium]
MHDPVHPQPSQQTSQVRRSAVRVARGWRALVAWLLVALALNFAVLPIPNGLGQSGATEPVDSAPGSEDDEGRMLAGEVQAVIVPAQPEAPAKRHACRGDDQHPPRSPYLDRLLRPPKAG